MADIVVKSMQVEPTSSISGWQMMNNIVVASVWPIALVIIAVLFRKIIISVLERAKNFTFEILGSKINVTLDELESSLKQLMEEVTAGLDDLKEEHYKLFKEIRQSNGAESIQEIINRLFKVDFTRNSSQHKFLRELRGMKLIRPSEGGKWERAKHPVATQFARLVIRAKPDRFD
jgi:hypothetical protein